MKKLILAAAAVASLLGTGAVATSASAMPQHFDRGSVGNRDGFRGDRGVRDQGFRDDRGGRDQGFRDERGFRGDRDDRGFRGLDFRGQIFRAHWERGGFWPRGYGVIIVDPFDYGLYAAPYGYEWVQAPDGSFVLVSLGGGVIADVVIR